MMFLKSKVKAQEQIDFEQSNANMIAIFDALAELPICVSDDTYSLVNIINGISVSIEKLADGKYQFCLYASDRNTTRWAMDTKSAENILAAWTVMSKPYFMLNWNLNPSESQSDIERDPKTCDAVSQA